MKGAWLGDLLVRAGMDYLALDIFPGYQTEIMDLNSERLPDRHLRAWNVVLNCGTTEHIANQLNAFKVIHDALDVGGVAYHDVPMLGYVDHGYFNYNPVFFEHLATANSYEILSMSLSDPPTLEDAGRALSTRFAEKAYFSTGRGPKGAGWEGFQLPTATLTVVLRKTRDGPFRVALETGTTVGGVTSAVARLYDKEADRKAALQEEARQRVRRLLFQANHPALSGQELNSAYEQYLEASFDEPFPSTLERRSLQRWLEIRPGDAQLSARLALVENNRQREFPLLRLEPEPARLEQAFADLAFDEREANFRLDGDDDELLSRIVAAYHAYERRAAVELFPQSLEAPALEILYRRDHTDQDLNIRIGKVMGRLTPQMPTGAPPAPDQGSRVSAEIEREDNPS
jgi:hypothetical protein